MWPHSYARAGAVILAKTNLSEWANFRSEHSTSGWSSRGGQTHNPYALDRNPCGSSSGSGVAVAANLCSVAVGTETDGSVVCPSNANGIVGVKPTVGLVSRSGIIPISHSQDTAGPMARSVREAAILLGIIAGVDPDDPATVKKNDIISNDYTQYLTLDGLRGARIGVAGNFFGSSPDIDRVIKSCIQVMKDEGAVIIDEADIDTKGKFDETEYEALLYEFKHDLNQYLKNLGPDVAVHSLEELIDFNEKHRERVMPYFEQERLVKAQAKGPLTENSYLKNLENNHRMARDEGIDATLQKHNLDAIVAPTGGPAWPTDLVNGDHYTGASSSPAAVAGYPNITVPAGYIHGLPIGISFFASAYQEPNLFKIAYTRSNRLPRLGARQSSSPQSHYDPNQYQQSQPGAWRAHNLY